MNKLIRWLRAIQILRSAFFWQDEIERLYSRAIPSGDTFTRALAFRTRQRDTQLEKLKSL